MASRWKVRRVKKECLHHLLLHPHNHLHHHHHHHHLHHLHHHHHQTHSVMSEGLSKWQISLSLVLVNHWVSEIMMKPTAMIIADTWHLLKRQIPQTSNNNRFPVSTTKYMIILIVSTSFWNFLIMVKLIISPSYQGFCDWLTHPVLTVQYLAGA